MSSSPLQQPTGEGDSPCPQPGAPPKIEQYFRAMIATGASDLHLKAGAPPRIRVNTQLSPVKSKPMTPEMIGQLVQEVLTEAQQGHLAQSGQVDLAYEMEGSDRFRMNVYRQRGHTSIAVRRVKREIPGFEALHLPPIVKALAGERQGLILLSGPTGSGKSTTIAAMLEHINLTRPCHIVTLEDPIEYIYQEKQAVVDQREIGIDVASFEEALKYLPREDPDVVLIGEIRDASTLRAALRAAETGHLAIGSIHASTAPGTVTRAIEMCPAPGRALARTSLGMNLRAVVCQRLLPCVLKGVDRAPAVEVLLSNPSVRQLIEEGRDAELADVIRACERDGMQSFSRSLLRLIELDCVDPRAAYEIAPNVEELKMLMKGISTSPSGLIGRT